MARRMKETFHINVPILSQFLKISDKWLCKGKVSEVVKNLKLRLMKYVVPEKVQISQQNMPNLARILNCVWLLVLYEMCTKCTKCWSYEMCTKMWQNLGRSGWSERCDKRSCQRILLKYFTVRWRWQGGGGRGAGKFEEGLSLLFVPLQMEHIFTVLCSHHSVQQTSEKAS